MRRCACCPTSSRPSRAWGCLPPCSSSRELQRGIILVTGETGSGKSTTMAALLDQINHTRTDHIITLEDPIEYVHTSDRCVINQREIGTDTESYADALRAVLREDPDVILIGEMRDLNTIETALTAAETGHLVLATLHTKSAARFRRPHGGRVPRRPAAPDPHAGVHLPACRAQPAAGAAPRRRPRAGGLQLMMVTPAIRNLIREGKTPQIANALSTSAAVGSITMDNALIDLYRHSLVDAQTAIDAAHDVDYVTKNTGRF